MRLLVLILLPQDGSVNARSRVESLPFLGCDTRVTLVVLVLGVRVSRIMLTNDDGVDAPGLAALARRLQSDGHELVVVAPVDQRSGVGASLGPTEHDLLVRAEPRRLSGVGANVHAVDAPPALAVMAAAGGAFGFVPSMVVSGVNAGYNTGAGMVHSGTVGAAMTGATLGCTAVAISCGPPPEEDYRLAAEAAAATLEVLVARPLAGVTFNVNVPPASATVRDVRAATVARDSIFNIELALEADGLRIRRADRWDGFEEGSDSALVLNGVVTVTALDTAWRDVTASSAVAEAVEAVERHMMSAIGRSSADAVDGRGPGSASAERHP